MTSVLRELILSVSAVVLLLGSERASWAISDDNCYNFGCTWPGYSESDFPARISSLEWPNRVFLNSSHLIDKGQWAITLGSNVGAFFSSNPVTGFRTIMIRGLNCKNSVVGDIPCTLSLNWHPDGAKFCSFDSADLGRYDPPGGHIFGTLTNDNTVCPLHLRLAR